VAISITHTTVAVGTDAGNGEIRKAQWNEAHTVTGVREALTADVTYYVRSDGNDSNTGLANTSGGAFATIQKAYDTILTLDLAGYDATIKIGHTATFTAGLNTSLPPVGGNVILEGDTTTPANTVISTTSASCITWSAPSLLTVRGLTLQTTTSGSGIFVFGAGAKVFVDGLMVFGATATAHIYAFSGGNFSSYSNYTITGNAGSHIYASNGGTVNMFGQTVTLTGTPAFTTFALANGLSILENGGVTYSGSATGTRYGSAGNSIIETYGGGANYFPGNSAGYTATGGIYS
jgi:hypothetical protein